MKPLGSKKEQSKISADIESLITMGFSCWFCTLAKGSLVDSLFSNGMSAVLKATSLRTSSLKLAVGLTGDSCKKTLGCLQTLPLLPVIFLVLLLF